MMKLDSFCTLLICSFLPGILLFPAEDVEEPSEGKLWAVLVAGSDGWGNYRHQADICHAYQILHKHGIPDERIIVFMKDDIAHNEQNPTPGVIINHPNGTDVYKGVLKDYTGDAVTPDNFIAALKGDHKALKGIGSGKVLNSGPNDHVFVNFADHGGPGLVEFPGVDALTATHLIETIKYMHEKKKYGKMVLYFEACFSGTMFAKILPKDINAYATTAANTHESSYACYFDPLRKTYLGDVYSCNWMEDTDKEDIVKESLEKQYEIVKEETNTSHVMQYGDVTLGKLTVSEFQGRKEAESTILPKVEKDSVPSGDVPLEILKHGIEEASTDEERESYEALLKEALENREFMLDAMKDIVAKVISSESDQKDIMEKHSDLNNFDCYDQSRQYFQDKCFKLSKNPYGLQLMYVLVNLCEHGIRAETQQKAMEEVCTHDEREGIY